MLAVLPASAVPENVVLTVPEIMPSSFGAGLTVGMEGVPGATVSIVTLKAPDCAEVLPAGSVWVALMLLWTPSLKTLVVIVALPLIATALPTGVPLSRIVTVLPVVAETVNVGVLMRVMLSEVEDPVSLAAVRLGVPGTPGAVLSTVKVAPLVGAEVIRLPAGSVPTLSATVSVPLPVPTM